MDATEKVTRGAKWLDKHFPGWEREIDLTTLNLNCCTACICGQSLRKYVVDRTMPSGYDVAVTLEFGLPNQGEYWGDTRVQALNWAVKHGFYPTPGVEEAWVELIKERFNSGNLSDVV